MKCLVPNLETKNSEVQPLIKSLERSLKGERIGKLMKEIPSLGVSVEVLMKGPLLS